MGLPYRILNVNHKKLRDVRSVTILITRIRGLATPLIIATHEPPSRVSGRGFWPHGGG